MLAARVGSSFAAAVLALAGVGASTSTAATANAPISVTVERGPDNAFVVDGAFDSSASPRVVWLVLTDYERIQDFVSTIHRSTIKERAPGRVVLEQYGVGRAWMVSLPIHVMLDVREHGETLLTFRDTCGESFTIYEGKWGLTPANGGTHVTYHLKAGLTGRHPAMLAKAAFRGIVKRLLAEVRTETDIRSR